MILSSGKTVICFCFFIELKAKIESDRLIVSVGKKAPQETGIKVKNHSSSSSLSLAHRRDFKQLLQGITGEGPLRLMDINFKEFAGFQIALPNKVDSGERGLFWRVWHTLSYRKNRASAQFGGFSLIRFTNVFTGCKTSGLSKCLRHPQTEPSRPGHPDALQFAADFTETDPRARRRYLRLLLWIVISLVFATVTWEHLIHTHHCLQQYLFLMILTTQTTTCPKHQHKSSIGNPV